MAPNANKNGHGNQNGGSDPVGYSNSEDKYSAVGGSNAVEKEEQEEMKLMGGSTYNANANSEKNAQNGGKKRGYGKKSRKSRKSAKKSAKKASKSKKVRSMKKRGGARKSGLEAAAAPLALFGLNHLMRKRKSGKKKTLRRRK